MDAKGKPVVEVAKSLGVSRRTIDRLIAKRKLKAWRVAGRVVVSLSSLAGYLAANEVR